MSIISISNLNFGYKKNQSILKELNLEVPKGSIYGFLGANGAGKSTTIRNVLGLLKPQSGKVLVFGKEIRAARPEIFRRIGSLIESPSLYPHLSADDNLAIASKYRAVDKKKIGEVLEKVGLLENRKKKVKNYSTGMKQRLGLAIALLHDPELLLLDEPTNGLDPSGITEIRKIILRLREEGSTILLSSHLLAEVERIATHVGIIKSGKMIFEGSLDDLEALKFSQQTLALKIPDANKAQALLKDFAIVSVSPGELQVQIKQKEDIPKLIKMLVAGGIDIYEVRLLKSDLEKMFMSITNE